MTTQYDFDILENEKFLLKGRLSAEENYVEGVTQFIFGFPNTKILFHTIIEPKNESIPELRKASQYLTMPTVVAIEFAHLVLTTAKQSEDRLMKDLNEGAKDKIKAILKNVKTNVRTQEP